MPANDRRSPFRREAKDAQRAQPFGGIVLVRPVPLTVLTVTAASMAFSLTLLLALGSYTRRVGVAGIVTPDTGLVKVYAPYPGIVIRKAVVEGERVTKGMTLYTVSTDLQSSTEGHTQAALIKQAHQRKNSLLHETETIRQLHERERGTLTDSVASLRVELARLDDQIASQQQRISIAAEGVARYQRLLAQDFISTDQFRERQVDQLDQKSKLIALWRDRANASRALKQASGELASLELRQQNQLLQLSRTTMDVDRMLIESEARRELAITAPETGIATAVIAEPGQMVDPTHPAASIVPDGARWQVFLFVPSTAVGFVQIGDSVRVRYLAYPYQKFGQYHARITSVARTALSAEELSKSGMMAATNTHGRDGTFYRVTALLDEQGVTVHGKPHPLQAGMMLQADILQERRRLYEWALEPLYTVTRKL